MLLAWLYCWQDWALWLLLNLSPLPSWKRSGRSFLVSSSNTGPKTPARFSIAASCSVLERDLSLLFHSAVLKWHLYYLSVHFSAKAATGFRLWVRQNVICHQKDKQTILKPQNKRQKIRDESTLLLAIRVYKSSYNVVILDILVGWFVKLQLCDGTTDPSTF